MAPVLNGVRLIQQSVCDYSIPGRIALFVMTEGDLLTTEPFTFAIVFLAGEWLDPLEWTEDLFFPLISLAFTRNTAWEYVR
jgi:hypothetical protein